MLVRPEHYPQVPRFLHGHNPVVTHRVERPAPEPCACGCGGYPRTAGRRYRPGHASTGRRRSEETRKKLSAAKVGALNPMYGKPARNRKEPQPAGLCECGCGAMATPGRRYITGHNTLGSRMSNFTGRYVSHGYVRLWQAAHPYADRDGFVLEHRLVVEDHLRSSEPTSEYLHHVGGRLYLRPDIVVHHVDGVKDNNERDNLMPLTVNEHTRLHHAQGDILGA